MSIPRDKSYDRRCQLGASRRRLEDAEALCQHSRWSGSIYLGGYAIECSLKSLICHQEHKHNFQETSMFKKGVGGARLHQLQNLMTQAPRLYKDINLDRTGKYKNSWTTITSLWKHDQLRYSDKVGEEAESKKFIEAVKQIHNLILRQQGEA